MSAFVLSARICPAQKTGGVRDMMTQPLTDRLQVQFWTLKEGEALQLGRDYLRLAGVTQKQLMQHVVKGITHHMGRVRVRRIGMTLAQISSERPAAELLIVDALWAKLGAQFPGGVVAALVAQDELYLADAGNADAVSELRELLSAKSNYEAVLCSQLLYRSNGFWQHTPPSSLANVQQAMGGALRRGAAQGGASAVLASPPPSALVKPAVNTQPMSAVAPPSPRDVYAQGHRSAPNFHQSGYAAAHDDDDLEDEFNQEPGFFASIWHGEEQLWKVFVLAVVTLIAFNKLISPVLFTMPSLIFTLGVTAYLSCLVFLAVALWRSARHEESRLFAGVARLFVVIFLAGGAVGVLAALVLPGYQNQVVKYSGETAFLRGLASGQDAVASDDTVPTDPNEREAAYRAEVDHMFHRATVENWGVWRTSDELEAIKRKYKP